MRDLAAKRALVEKVTSLPGYTRAVGTEVVHVEVGCVHMALRKRPDLLQFNGFFHGGVITGLVDHAAGAAVTTALPEGLIAITIDLHVNFLAAADGASVVATARALHVGKTICVAQAEVVAVSGAEERLCATGTVTLRAVPTPRSARAS